MIHTFVVVVRGGTQDIDTTGHKIQHILEECSAAKLLVQVSPIHAADEGEMSVEDGGEFVVFTQAELLR